MTHRVVTPVNLKERIALLQQKASGGSSSAHAPAASPTSPGTSMPTSVSASSSIASSVAGASSSALRDRIAKFEKKGGVPVPRGSFGIGAPPPPVEQTHEGKAARKKGELYGNRIARLDSRAQGDQMSPPSALRPHLTGNVAVSAASSRSLTLSPSASESSALDVPRDPPPVRKRSCSTSSLATKRPASAIYPTTGSIMSGNFDEGGSSDDDAPMSGALLFAPGEPQEQLPLARRSSISGADGLHSFTPDSFSEDGYSGDANGTQFPHQGPSEGGKVSASASMPQSASDDQDHKIISDEDHQKDDSEQRADNVALIPAEAPPVDANSQLGTEDFHDDSSVKTPVVATFSPSATSAPLRKERAANSDGPNLPSEDSALSDAFTDASSPLTASFEVGKRAYGETRRLVVIPPAGTKNSSIANILEQGSQAESSRSKKPQDSANSGTKGASALGISGTDESRGSTETVSPSTASIPANIAEKSALTPQSTGSSSVRRRCAPAPIIIQREREFAEPSLDPKVGPKSFHAVVHGKTVLPARFNPSESLPTANFARQQVSVVRSQDDVPDTPGSPDLSALVAQAMYLEQRLVSGEVDVGTPKPDVTTFQQATKSQSGSDSISTPQSSGVAFPRSSEASDGIPARPPKSRDERTLSQLAANIGAGLRKSWSRSSGNASSEDSAPVLTPPSPTFDLSEPLFEEPRQIPALEAGADVAEEPGESDRRRSISSVFSSQSRSARKKVLSLFSRNAHSNSALAFPDEDDPSDSTHRSCDSHFSGSAHVSVYPSSTLLPSPVKETPISPSSPGLPVPIPRSPKQDTPDVPRPVSVFSTASGYSSVPSPLAVELFDSFPDVPRSVPNSFEQDRPEEQDGIEMRLKGAEGVGVEMPAQPEGIVEEDPQSPPPPTPPPKTPDLRRFQGGRPIPPRIQVNPLSSPPPPPAKSPPLYSHPLPPPPRKNEMHSPTLSKSTSSLSLTSQVRKSKSKPNLRLPYLPYTGHEREKSDSSASDMNMYLQTPPPPPPPSSFPHSSASIFGSISRSLGRRKRKNSATSALSGTGHGSTQ